eukprot:scaffold11299_cov40-Phaeocystis_antarctica.AAC.3
MGGTSSDDSWPPGARARARARVRVRGSVTPSPFISGCITRVLPQLVSPKSCKVTPRTRVSAARAGADPVGDSGP